MNLAAPIACLAFAGFSVVLWRRLRRARREAYIRDFILPHGLFEKLRVQHPQLSLKDCQLVAQGLRQFFLAYLKSGRQYVSMPSQVVDDLWHEFILYTKNYQHFCRQAFGGFLHHTPAAALGGAKIGNQGLRRTWNYTCHEENINPRLPTRLPLLFALDSKLNIVNGFTYVPNCEGVRRASDSSSTPYCGSDLFGAAGGACGGGDDASTDTSHDSTSSDSGGGDSGCGGGCGGGGCGGGGD